MTEYQPRATPPASPDTPSGPRWQLIIALNAGFLTWLATHDPSLAISAASLILSAFPVKEDKDRPTRQP